MDNDPIVLAHGRAMLEENDNTKVVAADIRHPAQILDDPELLGLIELNRPVAVIASAILHHLLDEDDPLGVIRAFTAVTPPGSCLFVSHFRTLADPESAALEAVMLKAFGRGVWRTDEQIAEYFARHAAGRAGDRGVRPVAAGRRPRRAHHLPAPHRGRPGRQVTP